MKSHFLRLNIVLFIALLVLSGTVESSFAAFDRTKSLYNTYTPKDEMINQWKALCTDHPQWASYEVIGKTVLGNDILLFKIGTPSGGRLMYDCQCHGCEDAGTEILYKFCKWLLESDEPLANHILRYNYHLIIPVLNFDTTSRQNMRRQYILENGTIIHVPYGVDLNRNGIFGWGETGSSNPNDDYSYRGLYGGSEPETMAYHNAVEKYRPAIYVNTHLGGEYLLHYSNTQLEQDAKTLKTKYEQQAGITNPYVARRGTRGGFIAADVDGSFGASGWLWEISSWENMEPTLDEWLDVYYPRCLPTILAFAEIVEHIPPDSEVFHDLSVTSLELITVYDESLNVSVTVLNNGSYLERFTLALYANSSYITSKRISLSPSNFVTVNFPWNTTYFATGTYTLKAYIWPVPKEANTENNTLELIEQQIVIPEFSETMILPLMVMLTFFVVFCLKKHKLKNS